MCNRSCLIISEVKSWDAVKTMVQCMVPDDREKVSPSDYSCWTLCRTTLLRCSPQEEFIQRSLFDASNRSHPDS